MKKLFTFILAFLFFMNILPSYAITATDEISMESFYAQLDEIILSCDNAIASTDNIEDIPTNRLIVKTKTNASLENYYDAIYVAEGYDGLHILQYKDEVDTSYAYNKLQSDDIEYVEYDYYLKASDTTQNTETSEEEQSKYTAWNSLAVNVGKAIDYIGANGVTCDTVTVAIIDTGIYAAHRHFTSPGRIVENKEYTFESSVLDENKNKVTVEESSLDDKCFHGTAVSSVVYDNTIDNVIIEPYRISNTIAMPYCLMFEAFDFAVNNKVDIINISAEGGIPSNSKTLFDKITNAVNNGIVVVVAAGNYSKSTEDVFPACHPDTITVSNTNSNSNPYKSSNFGVAVDVAAPGTDILCPTPRTFEDEDKNELESCDSYSTEMILSGTSYSAPLVSAAAALIKSIDPDITPVEVKRIIKETAYVPDDWEESCDGKNYGTGIVNFYNIAKAMLDPEYYSVTPTIKLNDDNKIEITVPEGTDTRIYYSIGTKTSEATVPTLDNHLVYSEPIDIENFIKENKGTDAIKEVIAVCHENGKPIGKPTEFQVFSQKSNTINYKETVRILSKGKALGAKWSVKNPDIVSVDGEGNITGVKTGETRVTVTYPSGEKEYYNITVKYAWWQEIIRIFFLGFLWY